MMRLSPRVSLVSATLSRDNFRQFSVEPYRTTLSKLGKPHNLSPTLPKSFKTALFSSEYPMTMDRSLKVQAGAIKMRNVMTRAERVARLKELDRFDENASIVGMPKVRVVKVSLKKKKKVKKEDEVETKKGKK